jgi:protoheme IX farnesyltransferase
MVNKLRDYIQFIKLRLTLLVVFSAVAGFLMGVSIKELELGKLLLLVFAGLLVTGSSNGFNQILEKHLDKLMSRTCNRPLPDGRMEVLEAFVLASLMGVSGLFILFYAMNMASGFLGLFALLSYAFLYTPLKRKTPFAVLVGAFPGAIPPLLGWVAATGSLDMGGFLLFAIQFIWQFPHFWAIAWVLDEDYKKAGFKLLPSSGGRDKASAFQVLVYSIGLIPISLLPIAFNMSGYWSGVVIFVAGCWFLSYSFNLYKTCDQQASKKMMFASFAYLPIMQVALVLDKI